MLAERMRITFREVPCDLTTARSEFRFPTEFDSNEGTSMSKTEKLARWKELYVMAKNRKHLPHDRASQCFAAMGKSGCPCCDAELELRAEIGNMISELERLYKHVRTTTAPERHAI